MDDADMTLSGCSACEIILAPWRQKLDSSLAADSW